MELPLEELASRIADLRARLPRHSVPAAMLVELEELEQEWEQRQGRARATQLPAEASAGAEDRIHLEDR